PRRIPHDRHVRDVLSVRVLCDRSVAVGAAGRGGAVRIRCGGLSPDRALRGQGESQCRHGADFFDFRAGHRDAGLRAILLHPGLSQRHPIMARRQNRLDWRCLPAGAAVGRGAGGDRSVRRAVFLHQPHRFRPRPRGYSRGRGRGGAGRHRQEPGICAGLGPRCGAGRARRRDHGDVLLHLSRCRRVVRVDRLCHGGAGRLRQRVRRLCRRHHRRSCRSYHCIDPAALAEVGRYLRGLSAGGLRPAARPVRIDLMDTTFAQRRRRDLIVAACLAVIAALVPLFVKDVYVQNIMVLTLMYAALSQSWNILSGYCGQISLGHALYFGLGAYTTALLFTKFGVLPWFGMVGGGVISALIAMALGYPCFRLRGHYFVIATIVIAEIALLLFQNWDWAGAALGIDIPIRRDSWLTFQFTRSKLPYFYFALVLACVAWLVTWWLDDSKWGYWWRAVKDNPDAAESLGVVVFNSKMGAAAVSAFLTAVGGSFYAQFVSYIDPESVMGFQFSLLMALPAVLGGIGTLWGPV